MCSFNLLPTAPRTHTAHLPCRAPFRTYLVSRYRALPPVRLRTLPLRVRAACCHCAFSSLPTIPHTLPRILPAAHTCTHYKRAAAAPATRAYTGPAPFLPTTCLYSLASLLILRRLPTPRLHYWHLPLPRLPALRLLDPAVLPAYLPRYAYHILHAHARCALPACSAAADCA